MYVLLNKTEPQTEFTFCLQTGNPELVKQYIIDHQGFEDDWLLFKGDVIPVIIKKTTQITGIELEDNEE